jgi:hypothetical protein
MILCYAKAVRKSHISATVRKIFGHQSRFHPDFAHTACQNSGIVGTIQAVSGERLWPARTHPVRPMQKRLRAASIRCKKYLSGRDRK